MDEILGVLSRPVDERTPLVALGERPVQLLDSVRPDTLPAPGKLAHTDYDSMVTRLVSGNSRNQGSGGTGVGWPLGSCRIVSAGLVGIDGCSTW